LKKQREVAAAARGREEEKGRSKSSSSPARVQATLEAKKGNSKKAK
jgi:hypothetical protein